MSRFSTDGSLEGGFGTGMTHPETVFVDKADNVWVGEADGSRRLLRFDTNGNLLAAFNPTSESRGIDHFDLAPDQCTLFYTSEGTRVKRFDVLRHAAA